MLNSSEHLHHLNKMYFNNFMLKLCMFLSFCGVSIHNFHIIIMLISITQDGLELKLRFLACI